MKLNQNLFLNSLKMLKIPGETTLPMPPGSPQSSMNSSFGGSMLKEIEDEMGYQQTLMYGRYTR